MTNREMRRHPVAAKPGSRGGGRPPSIRPTLTGGGGSGGRGGSLVRPNWIKDIISELKKVQWPTREEAWNLALLIIVVSVVVGVTLGGLDSGFGWFMEHTILK